MLQLSNKFISRNSAFDDAEIEGLDILAESFSLKGRLHLEEFLSISSANRLFDSVRHYPHWNLCTRLQQQHMDMDATITDNWPTNKMQELLKFVHDAAQSEFQYLYKTVPVYDLFHQQSKVHAVISEIYQSLNSKPLLSFFRAITGCPDIGFVDCQITCFEQGHFLTNHDDAVAGKNRVAAYVLNLTHDWQPDWGGALHFYNDKGHTEQAFMPRFNALNLFSVGQPHAVGYVTPFAGKKRYAITGWLRSGRDPMLAD